MNRNRLIIQTGAKEGQSLASHIENMIGVASAIKKIFNLNDEEERVLLTSITIHDLNKVPEYEEKFGYLSLISEKDTEGNYINIISECNKCNIENFFPSYKDYIEDIREIIGRHSAHLFNYGENLINNSLRKLNRDRIESLVEIIRAVDVLDLSKTLEEEDKKRQFLGHINTAVMEDGIQYKIVSHKISEDRGILTNIIHNGVVEYLSGKGLIPIAYYKDGTIYLQDKDNEIILNDTDKKEMLAKISLRIREKVFDNYKGFIKNAQSGIKVDEKCLEITSIENIVYEIYNLSNKAKLPDLGKKNKTIDDVFEKYKNSYSKDEFDILKGQIDILKSKVQDENDKKKVGNLKKEIKIKEESLNIQYGAKKIIKLINENKKDICSNEDSLRFSQFLIGVYNFLNSYVSNKNSVLSWSEFYNLFNLNKEEIEYLNLIPSKDALYVRPYIMGDFLYSKYADKSDELIQSIINYFNENINISAKEDDDIWSELKCYIKKNLILSFESVDRSSFKSMLENYSNRKMKKCCLCSNEFEAKDWMAGDVPYKLKVQNFSNRLQAGTREPKRKVCSVCQIEYLLHKSVYSSGGEASRKYLSIIPRSFNTAEYIRSVKVVFDEFKHKDIGALYFDTYNTFIDEINKSKNSVTPLFTETKMTGLAVPKYSEVFSNYFIMPIHFITKSKERDIWINSLLYALVFNQHFNSKVIISEFPLALFKKEDIDEIYIGDVPPIYKKLFEKNWSKEECLKTIELFINVFCLAKTLGESSEFVYEILEYLNDGELDFIYALYKVLKNGKNDTKLNKIHKIGNEVNEMLKYINEGDGKVSVIKELAEFACNNNLYGSLGGYLKDNSINKPLMIIFDNICRNDSEIFNDEDINALCKREMEKYFERTDGKYFGEKKIKNIDIYVDMFMNKLLNDQFKGDLIKLDRNKKKILSVYSFYFRSERSKKKEDK